MSGNQNIIHRRLYGSVVSAKMQKTVVVQVDYLKKHSKYQRYYKAKRRFKAHDERGEYRLGDRVAIEESKPISKEKRWRVVELIERPKTAEVEAESDDKGANEKA